MSFGGRISAHLYTANFNVTQPSAAANLVAIDKTKLAGFQGTPVAPFFEFRIRFTTLAISGALPLNSRAVTIAGVSFGSISAAPASMVVGTYRANFFTPYALIDVPDWLIVLGTGIGGDTTTMLGQYEVWGHGNPWT